MRLYKSNADSYYGIMRSNARALCPWNLRSNSMGYYESAE